MWGLLWFYDFILTLEKPNLYTGKYLMYYCVAAYFISFGFSVCSYFQNNNNFTSDTNLTCFVIDDNSAGYYIMLNVPILVYIVAYFYVLFSHGIDVIKMNKVYQSKIKIADSEQNLI